MIGTRFRLDFVDFAEKIKKSTNFKIAKYVVIIKKLCLKIHLKDFRKIIISAITSRFKDRVSKEKFGNSGQSKF